MADFLRLPSGIETPRKPIYLLADSQLLFGRPDDNVPFLHSVLQYMTRQRGTAAYVGASNADRPEFYALFVAAMAEIGITECCHVHAALPAAEVEFLAAADLILLAGGDSELGLRTFRANGVAELVTRRYHAGSVLMAVSAGAVQLGRGVMVAPDAGPGELLPGLELVPFVVDAHQEASGWSSLKRTVRALQGAIAGLGIPRGGAVLLHPDGTLEPVRSSAHEFTYTQSQLRHRMLVPVAAPHARPVPR